jgi:hypothetical protein
MKPEKHAIRAIEKQLADASPEIRAAGERVILALNSCLMNAGDPAALDLCRKMLAKDVAAFEAALSKGRQDDA